MGLEIRAIRDINEMTESASIIRKAFETVANEFNIKEEDVPSNPAFLTVESLIKSYKKGIELFGVFENEEQVGFVAIEKADNNIFYMEKLAVLPAHRHKGFGKRIMDFVMKYVKEKGGSTVSIGLINENKVLKEWYRNYGFLETGLRIFEHLPFEVCIMQINI